VLNTFTTWEHSVIGSLWSLPVILTSFPILFIRSKMQATERQQRITMNLPSASHVAPFFLPLVQLKQRRHLAEGNYTSMCKSNWQWSSRVYRLSHVTYRNVHISNIHWFMKTARGMEMSGESYLYWLGHVIGFSAQLRPCSNWQLGNIDFTSLVFQPYEATG
jgi:hypothetical protein